MRDPRANPSGSTCTTSGSIDPSDRNLPSIGIDGLPGIQTVTRTVTNVGPAGTYTVAVEEPAGIDMTVAPNTLVLGEGASAAYTVTFETEAACGEGCLDTWSFGSLTWNDGDHAVRSPIAVKPVILGPPVNFRARAPAVAASTTSRLGTRARSPTAVHGLLAADEQPDNVVDDPANDINAALAANFGVTVHEVTVPAGTRHLRASLFDGETDGADSNYTLFVWALGDADESNTRVTGARSAVSPATAQR